MNNIWSKDLEKFEYLIESSIDHYREKLTLYNYYVHRGAIFDLYSYGIWALSELKRHVSFHYSHGNHSIQYYIEEYRDILDDFACSAKNDLTKYMFSLAYDEVTNFLDHWLKL